MPKPALIQTALRMLDLREQELRRQLIEAAPTAETDDGSLGASDRKEAADREVRELMASAEVERDLAELGAIARARLRMREGLYGVCADCAADIDAARLIAQPAATRCQTCQTQAERPKATTH